MAETWSETRTGPRCLTHTHINNHITSQTQTEHTERFLTRAAFEQHRVAIALAHKHLVVADVEEGRDSRRSHRAVLGAQQHLDRAARRGSHRQRQQVVTLHTKHDHDPRQM